MFFLYACMCTMHVPVVSPGTGVIDGCQPLCGYWGQTRVLRRSTTCSQPLNRLFVSLQKLRNTLWKRNIFSCTCLLLYFLVGTKENIRVFKILIFFILIGLKIYIRYIETGKKHSRRKRINFK